MSNESITPDNTPVVSDDIVARLGALPVANIGDAQERLGVAAGIRPVWRGARVSGRAVTVEVAGGDNAGIHDAIPLLSPGDVLVVNGHGVTDRALIGELIGERLKKRGVAGIVIDGAVRDVDDLEQIGFPTFARAVSPAGPYKNGPWRVGVPVALGGAVVEPGDVIVGDADGVAVIRASDAATVLEKAEAKNADEARIRASIVQG